MDMPYSGPKPMGSGNPERRAVRDLVRRHLGRLRQDLPASGGSGEFPFWRQVRPQDVDTVDLSIVLAEEDLFGRSGLMAQRLLRDLNRCPTAAAQYDGVAEVQADLEAGQDERLRGILQRHVFGFLNDDIVLSRTWSVERLASFLDGCVADVAESHNALCSAVIAAKAPQDAARMFLIQMACSHETESAALSQAVLAKTGPAQKALSAITEPDVGRAAYPISPRVDLEPTLRSVGLCADTHRYGHLYLASSLSLINHFHLFARHHRSVFHCLGALHFTEAVLERIQPLRAAMLRYAFGDAADLGAFDAGAAAASRRRRILIGRLLASALDALGTAIVPQIARGIEEFWLLRRLADADLLAQIMWSDRSPSYRLAKDDSAHNALAGWPRIDRATAAYSSADRPKSQVFDEKTLLVVREGVLDLTTGHDRSVRLTVGEGILVPRHRLHEPAPVTATCVVDFYPIDRANPC